MAPPFRRTRPRWVGRQSRQSASLLNEYIFNRSADPYMRGISSPYIYQESPYFTINNRIRQGMARQQWTWLRVQRKLQNIRRRQAIRRAELINKIYHQRKQLRRYQR